MSRAASGDVGLSGALASAEKEILDTLNSLDLLDSAQVVDAVRTYQVLRLIAAKLRATAVADYIRGN